MTVMAIFQDVDKCMRCNGCVTACKREWQLKLPENMSEVIPVVGTGGQRSVVNPRQRLAIKSLRRGDGGPFMRYSCWHCPQPPCLPECPFGAIVKEPTGAVSVDNSKCQPSLCKSGTAPKPCEIGCQQGGYPKVGVAYESGPYAGQTKMNKCTLCTGRAGADGVVDPHTALPTRAIKNASGQFISTLPLPSGGALPVPIVPELAHEPACVSTCPAKAMKWDAKDNILAYLQDPANGYTLPDGTMNWNGSGAIYWAAKKTVNKLVPAKADPYVEDHVAPMVSGALTNPLLIAGAVALGGFAMLAERKDKIAAEELGSKSEEV